MPVVDTGGLLLHCPLCEKLGVKAFDIAAVDTSEVPLWEVPVPMDRAMVATGALLVSFVDGLLLHTPLSAVLEIPVTANEVSDNADSMLV